MTSVQHLPPAQLGFVPTVPVVATATPTVGVSRIVVIRRNGKDGAEFLLGTTKKQIWFGRDATCDVRINRSEVSSKHAYLERLQDGTWRLHHMSATNNTILNSQPVINPVVLCPGDVFEISKRSFRFDVRAPTSSELSKLQQRHKLQQQQCAKQRVVPKPLSPRQQNVMRNASRIVQSERKQRPSGSRLSRLSAPPKPDGFFNFESVARQRQPQIYEDPVPQQSAASAKPAQQQQQQAPSEQAVEPQTPAQEAEPVSMWSGVHAATVDPLRYSARRNSLAIDALAKRLSLNGASSALQFDEEEETGEKRGRLSRGTPQNSGIKKAKPNTPKLATPKKSTPRQQQAVAAFSPETEFTFELDLGTPKSATIPRNLGSPRTLQPNKRSSVFSVGVGGSARKAPFNFVAPIEIDQLEQLDAEAQRNWEENSRFSSSEGSPLRRDLRDMDDVEQQHEQQQDEQEDTHANDNNLPRMHTPMRREIAQSVAQRDIPVAASQYPTMATPIRSQIVSKASQVQYPVLRDSAAVPTPVRKQITAKAADFQYPVLTQTGLATPIRQQIASKASQVQYPVVQQGAALATPVRQQIAAKAAEVQYPVAPQAALATPIRSQIVSKAAEVQYPVLETRALPAQLLSEIPATAESINYPSMAYQSLPTPVRHGIDRHTFPAESEGFAVDDEDDEQTRSMKTIVLDILTHRADDNAPLTFKAMFELPRGAFYRKNIAQPMSVNLIRDKVWDARYASPDEFRADWELLWTNSMQWMLKTSQIYAIATMLQQRVSASLAAFFPTQPAESSGADETQPADAEEAEEDSEEAEEEEEIELSIANADDVAAAILYTPTRVQVDGDQQDAEDDISSLDDAAMQLLQQPEEEQQSAETAPQAAIVESHAVDAVQNVEKEAPQQRESEPEESAAIVNESDSCGAQLVAPNEQEEQQPIEEDVEEQEEVPVNSEQVVDLSEVEIDVTTLPPACILRSYNDDQLQEFAAKAGIDAELPRQQLLDGLEQLRAIASRTLPADSWEKEEIRQWLLSRDAQVVKKTSKAKMLELCQLYLDTSCGRSAHSEQSLSMLSRNRLKLYCDALNISYLTRSTKKQLARLILDAQGPVLRRHEIAGMSEGELQEWGARFGAKQETSETLVDLFQRMFEPLDLTSICERDIGTIAVLPQRSEAESETLAVDAEPETEQNTAEDDAVEDDAEEDDVVEEVNSSTAQSGWPADKWEAVPSLEELNFAILSNLEVEEVVGWGKRLGLSNDVKRIDVHHYLEQSASKHLSAEQVGKLSAQEAIAWCKSFGLKRQRYKKQNVAQLLELVNTAPSADLFASRREQLEEPDVEAQEQELVAVEESKSEEAEPETQAVSMIDPEVTLAELPKMYAADLRELCTRVGLKPLRLKKENLALMRDYVERYNESCASEAREGVEESEEQVAAAEADVAPEEEEVMEPQEDEEEEEVMQEEKGAEEQEDVPDLDAMGYQDLLRLKKELGISLKSRKKVEVLAALRAHYGIE